MKKNTLKFTLKFLKIIPFVVKLMDRFIITKTMYPQKLEAIHSKFTLLDIKIFING